MRKVVWEYMGGTCTVAGAALVIDSLLSIIYFYGIFPVWTLLLFLPFLWLGSPLLILGIIAMIIARRKIAEDVTKKEE